VTGGLSSVFNGGTVETIVIGLLVVGFLVYRMIVPRRLSARGLVIVPLILLYFLWRSLSTFHPTNAQIEEIAISSLVSVVLGLLAARQLRVYQDPQSGAVMTAGSLTYFLWWLGAFVIKVALAFAFGETAASGVSELDILIPVFLLMATRNLYLYWKASQLGFAMQ
jgi:hypothetical protein